MNQNDTHLMAVTGATVNRAEQFTVIDEVSANWVLRKIVEARAYQQRVTDWARRERARAKRRERFFMGRYGYQLEGWVRRRLQEQKGRRRSVALPAGCVGFRQAKAKLIVEDEQEVLAWVRERCPAAIRIAETVNKAELDAHFEQTGELPDRGVRLEPASDHLYVR